MEASKLHELKRIFSSELEKSLTKSPSKRLDEALRYALLGEGKRLRPLLVLLSAEAFSKEDRKEFVLKRAMPAALAVEYIHTYSLIHDDLPSMDNDDYRRGRLSLHRRFDEALAILAGDALQADAFFMLAQAPLNQALQCFELAHAAGRHGLVCGQAEDLANSHEWLIIHANKTARLFEACVVLGALSQGAQKKELEPYRVFGHHFGMAFQIKDDMDDKQGIYLQRGNSAALELLRDHAGKALRALEGFSKKELLKEILSVTFG